jgi:hypothetical protein
MRRGEQISLLEKIVIILIGGISISLILYNPKRNCEEETLKDYLPLQQEFMVQKEMEICFLEVYSIWKNNHKKIKLQ